MKEKVVEVRDLESGYVNSLVNNMPKAIEKMKMQIVDKLEDYQLKHTETICDKFGNETAYVKVNPIYINSVFFKSLNPIMGQEPVYNAESLGIVFDYYSFIIGEINDKIGSYPSSVSSFCKLAGITTQTLIGYRKSSDYNLRIVAEKIFDYIGDENLTLGQMGKVKETSTMFKLKTQNDMNPNKDQTVNININNDLDEEAIEKRIKKYRHLADKIQEGKVINE